MAVGSLPPDMFRGLRNSAVAKKDLHLRSRSSFRRTAETRTRAACAPQIQNFTKTKCRMSILAIRHPALQSMCSKD
jgi:hypothetical protein